MIDHNKLMIDHNKLIETENQIKNQWILKDVDEKAVLILKQRHGLSDMSAKLVNNRISNVECAERYINPSLKSTIPDPYCLLDMDKAVQRTVEAIKKEQKILVYSDYDVDGATSSSLIINYFKDIGHNVDLYIPDRITEGYGANTKALLRIRESGYDLVFMTDCGTTSIEPIKDANKAGLETIVLDHHMSKPELPDAVAIVNPNRIDQNNKECDLTNLCAAGVVFLFLIALQKELKAIQYRESFPDLRTYLDIVALGTVCDVMTLQNLNRVFVKHGLKVMQKGFNIGIKSLSKIAKIKDKISAYHLGFVLGPRINATGRIGDCSLGSRLLHTRDEIEADQISMKLETYNIKRKEIEKEMLSSAIEMIEKSGICKKSVIMVGETGWHQGVTGIVAGRIKELYKKPTFIVSFNEHNVGSGSGRSLSGIHLGNVIHEAEKLKLVISGGGHEMAAGFTVEKCKFDELYKYMDSEFNLLTKDRVKKIQIDSLIKISSVTKDFMKEIEALEPFGIGNPSPKFLLENLKVRYIKTFGLENNHMTLRVIDDFDNEANIKIFRCNENKFCQDIKQYSIIDVVGSVKINNWRDRSEVEIIPEDIKIRNKR